MKLALFEHVQFWSVGQLSVSRSGPLIDGSWSVVTIYLSGEEGSK
jgi:hypothetical protein